MHFLKLELHRLGYSGITKRVTDREYDTRLSIFHSPGLKLYFLCTGKMRWHKYTGLAEEKTG